MRPWRRLHKLEDCAALVLLAGAVVLLTVETICCTVCELGSELLKKVEGRK